MKRNIMMRVASVMLIAVLLSTCTISGTFAKYVTTESAEDQARVAKFGVVLQADGKLFGDKYGNGANSVPTTDDTIAILSVKADGNAVAPGTQNNDGLYFAVTGQPEVRTELNVTIVAENIFLKAGKYAVMVAAPSVTETSFASNTYYTLAGDTYTKADTFSDSATYYTAQDYVNLNVDYYPVVYTSSDKNDGTIAADSLDAIAAEYAKALNQNVAVASSGDPVKTYHFTKVYDPNFSYDTLNVAGDALKWSWAFEQDGTAEQKKMYNGADTILGDLMVGVKVVELSADEKTATAPAAGKYHLTTRFQIDITVTQVD